MTNEQPPEETEDKEARLREIEARAEFLHDGKNVSYRIRVSREPLLAPLGEENRMQSFTNLIAHSPQDIPYLFEGLEKIGL